jgi:hypothetical protein
MISSGCKFVPSERKENRILGRCLKSPAFGLFALFVLIALAGVHAVFATDASASAAHAAVATDGSHSTDASASGDSEANWVRVDSGAGGESGDQVLEIPQVACDEDPNSSPCDNDDDGTTGVAAAPRGNDDDTASAGSPDSDWGTADDYSNQPIYGVPYGYVVSRGPVYGNLPGNLPPSRRSPFPFPPMQTSSPITQAARPQLNPTGAWMTPPSMSQFSRPAGSPMASAPFRFR